MVAFNHALEGLAVDAEQPRGGLLVAARMREHARDVATLDLRERRPFFVTLLDVQPGGSVRFIQGRTAEVAYTLGQVFGAHRGIAEGCGAHDGVLQLAYVAGPVIAL